MSAYVLVFGQGAPCKFQEKSGTVFKYDYQHVMKLSGRLSGRFGFVLFFMQFLQQCRILDMRIKDFFLNTTF